MTLHDCGFQQGSWQCRGSHLKVEDKVPPSLRGVTEITPIKRDTPKVTAINVTRKRGRPATGDALTPAQRKAAQRARAK